MGLDYKELYEAMIVELDFLKREREKLKEENAILDRIREIQAKHLLDRDKKLKDGGRED